MSIDRNRLEQEAVKFLQRGKTDQAIQRYQTLVRDDPRDRRIRQKLAELYLQTGQNSQAEQHFRQLVKSFRRAGQEKRAIPLLRQLVKIKPDDAELQVELGDLQLATGFPDQARRTYEAVVERLERHHPTDAVPVVQKLIKLAPGELPVQIKLAEMYEAANWSQKACDEWYTLGKEARRLGRDDDRARFFELALNLRPDTLPILQDAAEARLALGEPQLALPHLQAAYQLDQEGARTLELLARTLEELGQGAKARPIWLAAAQAHQTAGDALARLEALRRALALGEDATLRAEVGEADQAAERFRLRLTDCDWAQPAPGSEEKAVYRAQIQGRYGFVKKAATTLEGKTSVAARVALAEIYAACGDAEGAAAILAELEAPSAEAAEHIELRRSVLEGREPELVAPAAHDELVDDTMEEDDLIDDFDDDDLIDDMDEDDAFDDATDPGAADSAPAAAGPDHEADGDAAFAAGDYDRALTAYRKGLMADPASETLLMKLGEVMQAKTAPPAPAPAPALPEPDFGAVFGASDPAPAAAADDAFSFLDEPSAPADDLGFGSALGLGAPAPAPSLAPPSPAPPSSASPAAVSPGAGAVGLGGDLSDAEALLCVGAFDRAEAAARAVGGLAGELVVARTIRARGDLSTATSRLRAAVGEAAETDPAYLPSILELAQLNAATGKTRAARRLLDEIEDIDESFAPALVARARRGIALL